MAHSRNQAVHSQSDSSKLIVEDEAMPINLPPGLPEIVLGYLDNDIKPIQHRDKQTKYPSQSYVRFRLFDRTLEDVMSYEAARLGNLILRGEEKEIEQALALIKKKPILLHCKTEATDPLGRVVKGKTLLQIAAIAGDVDLKQRIGEEKDRGLVERLIAVGKLSKEEIAEQLEVITGVAAQKENKARNERYLTAIKKFGIGICKVKADDKDEFERNCIDHIKQLEQDLQAESEKEITSGYIFDPAILEEAVKWFEDNIESFGGWSSTKSDIFWVKGFGKLQRLLSSRDAQVVRAGIGRLVDSGALPPRLLNDPEQLPDFYNSSSQLGVDFYLGYGGRQERSVGLSIWVVCDDGGWGGVPARFGVHKLMSSKNISIAKLMPCPDNRSRLKSCLVM